MSRRSPTPCLIPADERATWGAAAREFLASQPGSDGPSYPPARLVYRLRPNQNTKNARRRRQVLERDGRKCLRCGSVLFLTLDHVLPRTQGGTSAQTNLQALCAPCNQWKGGKHIDFRPGASVAAAQDWHYPTYVVTRPTPKKAARKKLFPRPSPPSGGGWRPMVLPESCALDPFDCRWGADTDRI